MISPEDRRQMRGRMFNLVSIRKKSFDSAKKRKSYGRMDELKKEMLFILSIMEDLELDHGFFEHQTLYSEIEQL